MGADEMLQHVSEAFKKWHGTTGTYSSNRSSKTFQVFFLRIFMIFQDVEAFFGELKPWIILLRHFLFAASAHRSAKGAGQLALAIQIHPASCTKNVHFSICPEENTQNTHAHTHIYIYIIICNMLGGNCDFCYLLLGERTQRWEIHSLHWKTISLDTNRREFYTEVSVRVRTRYD